MGRPKHTVNSTAATPPPATEPTVPPTPDPLRAQNGAPRHHITRPVAAPFQTNLPSLLAERARVSPEPVIPERVPPQNDPPRLPPVASLPQQARPTSRARNGGTSVTPRVATRNIEDPISAVVAVVSATQTDSSQSIEIPAPHRDPNVKVLMYATAGKRECSFKDVEYFERACLNYIKGLSPSNIRVIVPLKGEQMRIGQEFNWFFDPQDVVPGDLRILMVTGHGHILAGGTGDTVRLDLYNAEGEQIDTKILCDSINNLPAYCTLEVVLGICYAGGLVPAQHRVRVMGSSNPASPNHVSPVGQSDPPSSSPGHVSHGISAAGASIVQTASPTAGLRYLLKLLSAQRNPSAPSPLDPKANVVSAAFYFVCSSPSIVVFQVVWAASDMYEEAYTEVLLHGRQDRLCALIGAILRAWEQEGPNATRRAICDRVHESLREQHQARIARAERKRAKAGRRSRVQMPVQQPPVVHSVPDPDPQVALLLSSAKDENCVLDGVIFQPLDPPLSKSLMGGYAGGVIANAGQV